MLMSDKRATLTKNRYDVELTKEAIRLSNTSDKKDREIEQNLGLYPNANGRWMNSRIAFR
jgi:hypothetical protein